MSAGTAPARRPLGRTGLEVPSLAFGTAPLGDVFGPVDERTAIDAVHAAIDAGIDWFDTAPLYGFGLAEERLGRALLGRRDRVHVATKCCRDRFDGFDFSARRVTDSVEESLRRLRTDHVDLLQIHDVEFGDREILLEETLPAARRVQAAGKARFIGISGLPVRYLRWLAERAELDTLLSWGHCNLVEDELVEELVPLAEARGIGLINASPLLQGVLTDRGPPPWHRSPRPVLETAPRIAALCRTRGTDVASVAIRHAVEHAAVATTIVGMQSRAELEANLAALARPIPEGLLDEIAELVAPVKNMMWFEGRPENNIPPTDPNRYVPRPPSVTQT